MNAQIALVLDHATAAAKQKGHPSIELRHLLVGLQRAEPAEFERRFGTDGVTRAQTLLVPAGTYFGPVEPDAQVAALLERADQERSTEVLYRGLADLIGTEPAVAPEVVNSAAVPPAGDARPSFGEAMALLHNLVGLDAVKAQVEEWVQIQRINETRRARGMKAIEVSKHLVFTGNPGTGKTTVARAIAQVYAALGLLTRGTLVEVTRADLVAAYVGQTALKTSDVIRRASGGVLFIDEAYSLAKDGLGSENDFGRESIDQLVKEMEDKRGDLAVIVAGYPEPMSRFLMSNPGLSSRFGNVIEFPDYNNDELWDIFAFLCSDHGFVIEPEGEVVLREMFEQVPRGSHFGNARMVRNAFEELLGKQALRLADDNDLTDEELVTITVDDCRAVAAEMRSTGGVDVATGMYL